MANPHSPPTVIGKSSKKRRGCFTNKVGGQTVQRDVQQPDIIITIRYPPTFGQLVNLILT